MPELRGSGRLHGNGWRQLNDFADCPHGAQSRRSETERACLEIQIGALHINEKGETEEFPEHLCDDDAEPRPCDCANNDTHYHNGDDELEIVQCCGTAAVA